jgi:GTP pyrophosphokinase/guanosine-3',5'-bis(diphosphate) 3'-pyrophosphohydrolase
MRGRGVVVHTIDCERLITFEDRLDQWLDLHWYDGAHAAEYTATLRMTIGNGSGVLGRVCTLIGESGANISDLHFVDKKPDFFLLLIYVDLRDVQHLHTLMGALSAQNDVAAIERYRNIERSDTDMAKSG